MTRQKIKELEDKKRAAERDLKQAVAEMWPEGTPVRVMLSSSQKRPSYGTVVGHTCDGYLCVELDKPNQREYTTIKRVYWLYVCCL